MQWEICKVQNQREELTEYLMKAKKEQILCEHLQRIEENRKNGQKGYTPEEVHTILGQVIKETVRYRIMYLKQF